MKFIYHKFEKLPKLAWVAEVNIEKQEINVFCGPKVECKNEFFVAGVWNGTFLDGDFDKVSYFLGTGIKINANGDVIVSTPSHALEKIFLYEKNENFIFSNSLPFIMSYCKLSLDNKVNQYEAYLCSVLDGINNYKVSIPLADNENIKQYFCRNLVINKKGELIVENKQKQCDFSSFDDYFARMKNAFDLIKKNATDVDREYGHYGVVSTISSGYDSCACATVAKSIGAQTVVSLSGGKYDKDSGEDVAIQLGYKEVTKRKQSEYKQKVGLIDAEYVCSGELGTHLQFSVFEDLFADNLVFMGLRGDYYWGMNTLANDDFFMKDFFYYETNIGYIENALKNGYIVVPLPTFGSSNSVSIRNISSSEEMKPWSLGNDYDRPIPRRIVESAGVDRNSFGQAKSGGGFSMGYDNDKTLKRKMTEVGYSSFELFQKETARERKSIGKLINKVKFAIQLMPTYFNFAARLLHFRSRVRQTPLRMANPGTPSDLIFWGMKEMKSRYDEALS